jgi:hypothetical protein
VKTNGGRFAIERCGSPSETLWIKLGKIIKRLGKLVEL